MMMLDVFDVEMGQCAILHGPNGGLAMIDCGHNTSTGWTPSAHIRTKLKRNAINYLFITNADEDHFSDLSQVLDDIGVQTLHANWKVTPQAMRQVKLDQCGEISTDAQRYLDLTSIYVQTPAVTFDAGMGGVTQKAFCNPHPLFTDTNNLSLAVFFRYGQFQILFPGDLERPGWLQLLADQNFRAELGRTTALVASHHGRESGYCEEVFVFCKPQFMVISDKSEVHDTQGTTNLYASKVKGDGIHVVTCQGRRKVLTTRSDGGIRIVVDPDEVSTYRVATGSLE
jgi:beta-lactamase superfamily II metal-dependent hydrolase